jgi:hypothetical protein
LCGVDQRAGHPGVAVVDADQGGAGQRSEGEAHADADDQFGREDVRPVSSVDTDPGEHAHADGGRGEAGCHGQSRPEPGQGADRDDRADDDAGGEWQERDTGVEWWIAERVLQVVGEEQEHTEDGDADEQPGKVGAAPVAVDDDPHRQHRLGREHLDDDEPGQQQQCDTERPDGGRCPPAVGAGEAETVHQGDQPGRAGECARNVVACAAVGPAVPDEAQCGHGGGHRYRCADQECPAPRRVFGEDAAEHQAERTAATGDRAVQSEHLGPLLRLGERHRQQGKRGRRQDRAEGSLKGPGGVQRAGVGGQSGGGGRDGEPDEATDEGPLASGEVGDAPAEEEKTTECQRVCGDDPVPVGIGNVERLLRGRQCDIHNRHVENQQQLRHADDGHGPPPHRIRRRWLFGNTLSGSRHIQRHGGSPLPEPGLSLGGAHLDNEHRSGPAHQQFLLFASP